MTAAIDELLALLESVGATVTLHGKPVGKAELEEAALAASADRLAAVAAAPSWTFIVPKAIQSGNKRITNALRTHRAYKKAREGWGWWFNVARVNHRIPKAEVRRRVRITRIYAGRAQRMDDDNLVSGCKVVLDAMVRAELLVDDADAFLILKVDQRPGEANETHFTITEAP